MMFTQETVKDGFNQGILWQTQTPLVSSLTKLARITMLEQKAFNQFTMDFPNNKTCKSQQLESGQFQNLLKKKYSWHNQTKDSSLALLGGTLGKLLQLKNFRFKVTEWNALSDESLIDFSQGLQKLVNLKQLSLQFGQRITSFDFKNSHFSSFTSDGQKRFAQCLKQLVNLSRLDVLFGASGHFNQECVSELAVSLSTLQNLEQIKLIFEQGNSGDAESLDDLGKSINSLQNLREFRLVYINQDDCCGNSLVSFMQNIQANEKMQDVYLCSGYQINKQIYLERQREYITDVVKEASPSNINKKLIQNFSKVSCKYQEISEEVSINSNSPAEMQTLKLTILISCFNQYPHQLNYRLQIQN